MIVTARRFFAALTLLSVLLGTLGWAPPACATPPASHAAATVTDTPDGAPQHAAHGECDDTGDGAAGSMSGGRQTDHRSVSPGGCAIVAHCLVAVPAPTAAVPDRSVVAADPPRAGRETLPRGPALEPEFPPPRA